MYTKWSPLLQDSLDRRRGFAKEGKLPQGNAILNANSAFASSITTKLATPMPPSPNRTYRTADQRLGDFFDLDAPRASFSDSDFQQISSTLKSCQRQKWSRVPRLYTVLRIIGELQVLDDFIDQGITDVWFQ